MIYDTLISSDLLNVYGIKRNQEALNKVSNEIISEVCQLISLTEIFLVFLIYVAFS